MAATTASIFVEEDDSEADTISITSTIPEEEDKEYPVERILAEEIQDGQTRYLVKWDGYELLDSTWEPRTSFDNRSLIRDWQLRQQKEREGRAEPFNVEKWKEDWLHREEGKERRKARRAEKRRRLGIRPASDRDTDSEDDLPTQSRSQSPTRRKRLFLGTRKAPRLSSASSDEANLEPAPKCLKKAAQGPEVKRKGVAQKKVLTRAAQLPSSEEEGIRLWGRDLDSSQDSLFHDKPQKEAVVEPLRSDPTKNRLLEPKRTESATQASNPRNDSAPSMREAVFASMGKHKKVPETSKSGAASEPAEAVSGVPRTMMKRTGTTKSGVFANWTKPVQARQRERVNENTSRDSANKQFRNLSHQHRFQRYAVNEPAPDVNALQFIDPSTGKRHTSQIAHKPQVCMHWKAGTCKWTADQCEYLHHMPVVCDYWKKGNCKWTANQCRFLHQELDDDRHVADGFVGLEYQVNAPPSDLPKNHSGYRDRDRASALKAQQPSTSVAKEHPSLALDAPDTESMEHISIVPVEVPATFRVFPSEGRSFSKLNVLLSFDSGAPRQDFLKLIGANPEFTFEKMCLGGDFQSFYCQMSDKRRMFGEVTASDMDEALLSSLIEYLTLNGTGFVISNQDFSLMVYPANSPDWSFLSKEPGRSGLRFYVQSPIPANQSDDKASTAVIGLDKSAVETVCENLLDISEEKLFSAPGNRKLDKVVFLMFPREYADETRLLTRYLLQIGARVYRATTPGAWQYFRLKCESAVILLHPTVGDYGQIPMFWWKLVLPNINIFQLGNDDSSLSSIDAVVKYRCIKLFPSGAASLITDELFMYHPVKALTVLEFHKNDNANRPSPTRLLARPGLKDWLLSLIERFGGEDEVPKAIDRLKLYRLAGEIIEPDTTADLLTPSSESQTKPFLISPPLARMPTYVEKLAKDQDQATDELVNWFAGWCMLERERCRRFTVLHEAKGGAKKDNEDPRGWQELYQHVRIMTPAAYLKKMNWSS